MTTNTDTPLSDPFSSFGIEEPPENLTGIGSSIIILGPAGSGKTALAASASQYVGGQPILFVDCEGGTSILEGMNPELVKRLPVFEWQKLERFRRTCIRNANQLPWKTIIFDNLSAIAGLAYSEVVGDENQASQPKWGDINRKIIQLVKTFRDISRSNPVNIIFVAWDAPDKDADGKIIKDKNIVLTPQLQQNIPGMVDIIGHLSVLDNRPLYTRVLNFSPSPRRIGKFRRAIVSPAQQIPDEIYYGINDMPLPAILATLKEGMPWPKNKWQAPQTGRQRETKVEQKESPTNANN